MKKYVIEWETVESPIRPYYFGEVTVFATNEKEARRKAINRVVYKGGFSKGEIRIIAVV